MDISNTTVTVLNETKILLNLYQQKDD